MSIINIIVYTLFVVATINLLYLLVRERETLSFALKNLYRNTRRTLLTMTAIIIAAVAVIVVQTYIEAKYYGLKETVIRSELGHIQIQMPGFLTQGRSQPTEYLIDDHQEIIQQLKEDSVLKDLIKKTGTEIRFTGLIMGEGNSSVNFLGRGVEPDKEAFFSSFEFYKQGKELTSRRPNSVVVGNGLAELLQVNTGEYATVLTTTGDGGINVEDATIRGVFNPLSSELSRIALKAPIEFAQNLMGVDGVNKILILLHHTKDTEIAASRIREIFEKQGRDLTVYVWEDLAEYYQSVVILYGRFFTFFQIIVSFVIFFLIMNTMTMSIFERFNEIGTLRAIGFTKRRIINLLTSEAYFLGVFSAVFGIGIGMGICWFVNSLEILEPPPPGYNIKIPFDLSFYEGYYILVINAFFLLTVIAWISSFSPTLKSLKFKIVDCLRHS